ncbi:MAG: hypothetical protein WCF65_01050 [Parachlamydiaceae bacterium]
MDSSSLPLNPSPDRSSGSFSAGSLNSEIPELNTPPGLVRVPPKIHTASQLAREAIAGGAAAHSVIDTRHFTSIQPSPIPTSPNLPPVVSFYRSPSRESPLKFVKSQSELYQVCTLMTQDSAKIPLIPKEGDHANTVYLYTPEEPGALGGIFKPGLAPCLKAMIAQGICELLGLSKAILPAMRSTEVTVIAPQPEGGYQRANGLDGKPVLFEREEGNIIDLSIKSDVLRAFAHSSTPVIVLEDDDDKKFLAPLADVYRPEGKHVMINSVEYSITKGESGDFFLHQKSMTKTSEHSSTSNLGPFKTLYAPHSESDLMDSILVRSRCLVSCESLSEDENMSFKEGEVTFKITSNGVHGSLLSVEEPEETDVVEEPDETESESEDVEDRWSEEPCTLLFGTDNQIIVAPTSGVVPIELGKITLDGQKYDVQEEEEEEDGMITIIGRNITGMVQIKAENLFTIPAGHTKSLDITVESEQRDIFFSRVTTDSFIQAFIAAMILRTQDGKVVVLEQSNILFRAIPETGNGDPNNPETKLECVLIDLDESMPASNDYSTDPSFEGKEKVHIVRLGLMGFPQARIPLSAEIRSETSSRIRSICEQTKCINEYLNTWKKNISLEKTIACLTVLDKMGKFIDQSGATDWTMEQLFFYVFPEYKQQWDILEGVSAPVRASMIGFNSEQELVEYARRLSQGPKHYSDDESDTDE